MRFASLIMVAAAALHVGSDAKPHWRRSVADAFDEARRAHKPVLAVIHCPH